MRKEMYSLLKSIEKSAGGEIVHLHLHDIETCNYCESELDDGFCRNKECTEYWIFDKT